MMYSGDEFYGDEVTSGIFDDDDYVEDQGSGWEDDGRYDDE